jgi:uncharacterized membrane protein
MVDEDMVIASGYEWLVLAHVLAASFWLGGIAVMSVLGVRILRSEDADVTPFLGSLRAIGPWLFAPMPLIVLGAGTGLVAESDAWSFDQAWVQIGIGLLAVVFLVGAAHQARAAIAAGHAAERGDHREAHRQLRRWAYGMGVIVALILAAFWDMVFKPGL